MNYVAKDFHRLLGTPGFSDTLLSNHFTLYEGYVTNTNKLLEALREMLNQGQTGTPAYAEIRRRVGFEFNGMRLHEYYFENLGGNGVIDRGKKLFGRIVDNFGSYEAWEKDFKATGLMRGIGWSILYQDNITGGLVNQWINEHETGHMAGCQPVLVMDVFEHAYITSYGLKRADYIESFFQNIDWDVVESRLID